MRLELSFCSSFCATSTFIINGIDADESDFGSQGDEGSDYAEEYGCGNMVFSRKDSTPEVLKKYGITGPEYELIAGQLEAGLSFGTCGWCV